MHYRGMLDAKNLVEMNKNNFLLFVLLLLTDSLFSQENKIPDYSIVEKQLTINGNKTIVPHFVPKSGDLNFFDRINNKILTYYELVPKFDEGITFDEYAQKIAKTYLEDDSYGGCDKEAFFNIKYSLSINNYHLGLTLEGDYLECIYDQPQYYNGATYRSVTHNLDIRDGSTIQRPKFDFYKILSKEGTLNFIDKFWIPQAQKIWTDIENCLGYEINETSFFKVTSFNFTSDGSAAVFGWDISFPRVIRACEDNGHCRIPKSEIWSYMNEVGRKLYTVRLNEKDPSIVLDTELRLYSELPRRFVIIAAIDGKYPCKIVLDIEDNSVVNGLYYYDSKKEYIQLHGKLSNNSGLISELHNGNTTGFLKIDLNTKDKVIKWYSADRTKYLNVEVIDVIF